MILAKTVLFLVSEDINYFPIAVDLYYIIDYCLVVFNKKRIEMANYIPLTYLASPVKEHLLDNEEEQVFRDLTEVVRNLTEECALEYELEDRLMDTVQWWWMMAKKPEFYDLGRIVSNFHGAIMFCAYSEDVTEELKFLRDLVEAAQLEKINDFK